MLDRLRIDVASGVPIYVQLREQLLAAIGTGLLAPGERLPTMREVAVALRVDLNTVQHAWGEVERDGLIVTRRGRGTFVAETPPPIDPALRRAHLEALAGRTIAAARSLGLDPAEVAQTMQRIAGAATPEDSRREGR